MSIELKPIRSAADYEEALVTLERLWGAESGTEQGDRLDVLATLIDAYEAEHYPIDPPIPVLASTRRRRHRSVERGACGLRGGS